VYLGDDAGIVDNHSVGGVNGIDDGHDIHDGSGLGGGNDLDAGNNIHDGHYIIHCDNDEDSSNDTNNSAVLSDDDQFQASPLCNSPLHPDQADVVRVSVKKHKLGSSVADKHNVQTADVVNRNDLIRRCRKQCPL